MARVLAISSQVVYGPVGNTAATPPLHAAGHEVMQIPTVLLSHHPGHGKPAGQATSSELLENLLCSAAKVGAFKSCAAVMTGYFASVEQVAAVAKYIPQIGAPVILVDPVIGDHGELYVTESTAAAIRDRLLPLATIATPNAFELSWLTGLSVDSAFDAEKAARATGVPEVIATSIPASANLATLLVTKAKTHAHHAAKKPHVPHGTGDYLAGCYLAERLVHGTETAFENAMRKLDRAIAASPGATLRVT